MNDRLTHRKPRRRWETRARGRHTVTTEIGRLLEADLVALGRYEADGGVTVVGAWTASGAGYLPVGHRMALGGRNVHTLVLRTGHPVRIDNCGQDALPILTTTLTAGLRSAVGAPIPVAGRLWGVLVVASMHEPLPADTTARLATFTELVATAIANDEPRAELAASRARIFANADQVRRRIERDLHDGAQQRLVSLALQLRAAQAAAPPEARPLAAQLNRVADELTDVLEELREITRGIHPAVLTQGGLHPALKALARRSPVPVQLDLRVDRRLPEAIEIAAYYAVCEALTNTAKHAHASRVRVCAEIRGPSVQVTVGDDGIGGAGLTHGSGLIGLRDRIESLGGTMSVISPSGEGTSIGLRLPLVPARPRPGAVACAAPPATTASA